MTSDQVRSGQFWYAQFRELADAVGRLRTAQKSGGKGYKTPADEGTAKPLELKVDALLERFAP